MIGIGKMKKRTFFFFYNRNLPASSQMNISKKNLEQYIVIITNRYLWPTSISNLYHVRTEATLRRFQCLRYIIFFFYFFLEIRKQSYILTRWKIIRPYSIDTLRDYFNNEKSYVISIFGQRRRLFYRTFRTYMVIAVMSDVILVPNTCELFKKTKEKLLLELKFKWEVYTLVTIIVLFFLLLIL